MGHYSSRLRNDFQENNIAPNFGILPYLRTVAFLAKVIFLKHVFWKQRKRKPPQARDVQERGGPCCFSSSFLRVPPLSVGISALRKRRPSDLLPNPTYRGLTLGCYKITSTAPGRARHAITLMHAMHPKHHTLSTCIAEATESF